MAGIGVKLTHIFEKKTLAANLYGFFFSTLITVAPMILIIADIILMEKVLDISTVVVDFAPPNAACTVAEPV